MDEDYEQTLLVIKECFVYKIPPRTTSAGYKAADWDLSNPMWTGRLVITSKGNSCIIKLEDPNTGDVFAVCPVNQTAVETVNDSSRYFVLRIDDGHGRHAFVGIGFAERNEAFDFNSALQDHNRYVKQAEEVATAEKNLSSIPHKDYSLPEGSTIHVSIKTKKTGSSEKKTKSSDFGGLLLPPPPGSKSVANTQQTTTTPKQSSNLDIWGDFSGFTGSNSSQNSSPSPSNQGNDWVAFQ